MTNKEIAVCPECDSYDITAYARPDSVNSYRCYECDCRFDDPAHRQRRSAAPRKKEYTRALVEADPEVVGDD
jgi:Zn ribbon nucleic-acid-binding protein